MKHVVIFLVALLVYKNNQAQYTPLLSKNKIWYTCEAFKENSVIEFKNMLRDTVWFDTIPYLEVLEVDENYPYDTVMVGWIREDSLGRVYYRDAGNQGINYCWDTSDYMLYDFSLKKGDTMFLNSTPIALVSDLDTVIYKGVPRKRWRMDGYNPYPAPISNCWQLANIIEGVGNTNGLLESAWPKFENYFQLRCVQDSGVQLYPDTNCWCTIESSINEDIMAKVKVVPNPTSNNFAIANLPVNCTVEIFNSDGELLYESRNSTLTNMQLDVSKYPEGLYMVHLRLNDLSTSRLLSIIH